MQTTRRQFLAAGAGGLALAVAGPFLPLSMAATADAQAAIDEFVNGAEVVEGRISLDVPEIAENGNNVPVSFTVDSAMAGDDLVESVLVVSDGNPNPVVSTFNFTTMSGTAAAMTRVRLSQTQNVIAVARMSDGTCRMTSREVRVTIGGCGG